MPSSEHFTSTEAAKDIIIKGMDADLSFLCISHLKKLRWQTDLIPGFTYTKQGKFENDWYFGFVYANQEEVKDVLRFNQMTQSISSKLQSELLDYVDNCVVNKKLEAVSALTSYAIVMSRNMQNLTVQPFIHGQLEVTDDIGHLKPDHPVMKTFFNESLCGKRFAKYFRGNNIYFGTIDKYDPKEYLWHVKYDDGDEDENDFDDIKEGLKLFEISIHLDPHLYEVTRFNNDMESNLSKSDLEGDFTSNDVKDNQIESKDVDYSEEYGQTHSEERQALYEVTRFDNDMESNLSKSDLEGDFTSDDVTDNQIENKDVDYSEEHVQTHSEERQAFEKYDQRYVVDTIPFDFSYDITNTDGLSNDEQPVVVPDDETPVSNQATDDDPPKSAANYELDFYQHLKHLLRQSKISRDIDSIALLGNRLDLLVNYLEPRSILKLSRLISDLPSTSSRHAIKMRLRTRTGKLKSKLIPLHQFQNIRLGTVTAGNVRFHINFYCLRMNEIQTSKVHWRPLTTCRRLVIAAALNFARLLQNEMISDIYKEVLSLDDDDDMKPGLKELLELRLQHSLSMKLKHDQHWVCSGEWFYINEKGTNRAEASSCQAEAIPFLQDFLFALQLISRGILKLNNVWSWCVAPFDTTLHPDGTSITPFDMQEQGKQLFYSKYFVLTAAGVKHDFLKYPPFVTVDNVLTDSEEYDDSVNEADFNRWLLNAGSHNMKSVLKCFKDRSNESIVEDRNVIITIDDALNIIPLERGASYLPVANNRHTADILHQMEQELSSQDCNDISEEEEEEEYAKLKISTIVDNILKETFPSSLNSYPVFNCPLSECEHTGHIPLIVSNDEDTRPLVLQSVNQGIASNGAILGGQKYVTSAKGMKYSNCLQSLGVLQNMDRATYGLMHGSRDNSDMYAKHMKKCLELLDRIDYSRNTFLEMNCRKSSLRLECFRLLKLHNQNGSNPSNDQMIASFKKFPLHILEMPVWVVGKRNFLHNYCDVLNKAKRTLSNVFKVGNSSPTTNHHPRLLSKEAKMVVQLCSEIISSEIGTPSGYCKRGPICVSMIDRFLEGYNLDFLSNQNDDVIREISETEKGIIGFDYGLDPSIWNFNDQFGRTISQVISDAIYTPPSQDVRLNQSNVKPRLSTKLIRDTQKILRSKLFHYQKNNKEKDIFSWLLFVSEVIMIRINQKRLDDSGSAFDAINHQEFSYFALHNQNDFQEMMDGLADIFWTCYEWEWQSDILRGVKVECDWPRTKSNAMEMNQILSDLNLSIVLAPAKARGNRKGMRIKSIDDLAQIIFQDHHRTMDHNTNSTSKPKNWESTIYLSLFKHICDELSKAKMKCETSLARDAYLLSQDFFLSRMAYRLATADSGHNYDPVILWATTKSNRLKSRGSYIEVDSMSLAASAEDRIQFLKDNSSTSLRLVEDQLPPFIRKSLQTALSRACLTKMLTSFPFPLNSTNRSQRLGGSIGFGKILMISIVSQVGEELWGLTEIDMDNLTSVDPEKVWSVICGECLISKQNVLNIQRSLVYKLWNTYSVFHDRWKTLLNSLNKQANKVVWKEMRQAVKLISFYDSSAGTKPTCLKTDDDLSAPYTIDVQFIADLKELSRIYVKFTQKYDFRKYIAPHLKNTGKTESWTCQNDFVLHILRRCRTNVLKRDVVS